MVVHRPRAGMNQLEVTAFRLSSMVIVRCVPEYLALLKMIAL